jgi:hypothetical protein
MDWPVRVVRLASGPQEAGLWCNPEGLSLTGRPLLQKKENGLQPKALPELQEALDDAYGATLELDARNYLPGLKGIARSLNRGDLALAMIGSVLLKLPDIPEANTRKYSDEQARDSNGRWTQGAEGDAKQPPPVEVEPKASQSLASVDAEAASAAEEGIIARLAPRVLSLLGDLAGAIAFPVAVAVGVLVPTNRNNIHSGDLPGFPELSYRSDEGMVTISRLDATGNVQHLYEGAPDKDGFYRDADGQVIGRQAGTGVLFDKDALAELTDEPTRPPEAGTDAALDSDAEPATDDDEPKVCPPRTKEDITGRSPRALAYQNQITGLPAGWDVLLRGVRYDGCDKDTQRMQEAKGLMPDYLMKMSNDQIRKTKFYYSIINQAGRQNTAAIGRGVDWYFADERLSHIFEEDFKKEEYQNITVHYEEAIVKKIEDCIALINHSIVAYRQVSQTTFLSVPEERTKP